VSPSHFSTKPLSANSRISRAMRGGSAKIERTAKMSQQTERIAG